MRSSLPLILLAVLGCRSDDGFGPRTGFDVWQQADNNRVDILFVVDDSNSMAEEQAALATGFTSFASQLDASLTDFHLGVITTTFDYADPLRGQLVGDPLFLTQNDPGYAQTFGARAQTGVGGSDREKGLEAAAYALSPAINLDVNGGFLRPAARLLLVFVSDEEDCSDGGALGDSPADECYNRVDELIPVENYVRDFRELKDDPSDVTVATIVGQRGDEDCVDGEQVYGSRRFAALVRLMAGSSGNICDGDWSGILGDLGLNATGIQDSFLLTRPANPDTLVITVDGVEISGWTYDSETLYVTFDAGSVPERGSQIRADYEFVGVAPVLLE